MSKGRATPATPATFTVRPVPHTAPYPLLLPQYSTPIHSVTNHLLTHTPGPGGEREGVAPPRGWAPTWLGLGLVRVRVRVRVRARVRVGVRGWAPTLEQRA
eukprot:scaffold50693_cov30-Phaeocystis_antarctica.AAC.1